MKLPDIETTTEPRLVRPGSMSLLQAITLAYKLRLESSPFGRGRIAHARKSGPGRRHRSVQNAPGDKLHRKWYGRTQASERAMRAQRAPNGSTEPT